VDCGLRIADFGFWIIDCAVNSGIRRADRGYGSPTVLTHAAHEVMLTGEIKDDAIVVSKIEMPKPEKK